MLEDDHRELEYRHSDLAVCPQVFADTHRPIEGSPRNLILATNVVIVSCGTNRIFQSNQICYKNKIQIFFFGHFLKLFEYAVIIPIKAIENKVIIITIATTAALGHCCPDFVVSKIKIGNVGS